MKTRSSRGSSAPRLKERLREATGQAILAAAESALARDGVHGATMEAIAAEAGVAVGTLYNYFGDRQALLSALLEARRKELVARLDAALQQGGRFREQLELLVSATLAHVREHATFFRIALEAEHAPVLWSRGAMRELHARCQGLIEQGVRQRVLRSAPAQFYASLLLGMLRGAAMVSLYQSDAPDVDEATRLLTRVFLDGAAERGR